MKRPEQKRPTVLIFLPDIFSARNFLFTPLWDKMIATPHISFVLASGIPAHGEYVMEQRVPNIRWEPLGRFFYQRVTSSNLQGQSFSLLLRQLTSLLFSELSERIQQEIHARLIFRFNHIKGFRTHLLKQKFPGITLRKKYGEPGYLGWPYPESKTLFALLSYLHQKIPWFVPGWLVSLFQTYCPDLVVIAFPQSLSGFMISHTARRFGIPVTAYINSWDQPTTKGLLPRDIRRFMVWNYQMKQELIDFHEVPSDRIHVVGGAHLDLYHQKDLIVSREEFFHSIGVDPARRLLVYGTYPTRLGTDEPAVARHIAEQVAGGAYPEPVTLVIRPHPLDNQWMTRFGMLNDFPHVQVQRSSDFGLHQQPQAMKHATSDLKLLLNLMKHADVVLTGPGTLALDAIAFDTPVINIGFDGDRQLVYHHSIQSCYEFNHYANLIRAGGTRLVKSYAEMDAAIRAYLHDPTLDTAGRDRIRREQLEPFDGKAGERVVHTILQALESW
ncbi:MAG: UDP-N-acetyl glucosamine 2-epimerase [Chloroflexaceae bacterium]|nr:UDP-N-acetyl glucosamine 2-epimerase [Chloroflexaceae bacterium]